MNEQTLDLSDCQHGYIARTCRVCRNESQIPADVLEELSTAENFAEAATVAYEVTLQLVDRRREELREAEEAYERASVQHQAASRASTMADEKLRSIRRREGIVRTADGYQLVKTP